MQQENVDAVRASLCKFQKNIIKKASEIIFEAFLIGDLITEQECKIYDC